MSAAIRQLMLLSVAVALTACGRSQSNASSELVTPDTRAHAPADAAGATVTGTGPSGTLVVLEPLFEHEFPKAAGPTYMDQTGLEFVPDFLTAQTGQVVQFRNNEDVLHNVRVQETDKGVPVFNVATIPYNSYTYRFEGPGYYGVSCDIHSSMRALILVTSSPYAITADGAGQFAFARVVPGQYTVTWFEKGERQQKQVDIRQPSTYLALP